MQRSTFALGIAAALVFSGFAQAEEVRKVEVSYGDLDLSSYATVGDLVTAINGISGLSASVDSDGHLSITATGSGNGVAINEMTQRTYSEIQHYLDSGTRA